MAEQAALNARNTAAAALSEELRQLRKYKDSANPKKRLLEQKLKRVEEAKEELMTRHYHYGEKAGKQLESEEMVDWLSTRLDEAVDTMDEVFCMIEDIDDMIVREETTVKKQTEMTEKEERRIADLKIAELQVKNDEGVVKDRLNKLKEVIEDEEKDKKQDGEIAEILLNEVEVALGDQIKSWNQYKDVTLNDEDLQAIFRKEADIKTLVAEIRSSAQAFINRLNPKQSTHSTIEQASTKEPTPESGKMKTEPMKLPKFSGNCREYARFKKDFKDIVETSCPNLTRRIFTLKDQCLVGEPKKLVTNMTTIPEIWERLDLKYGDSIDIVNMVIEDLQEFKISRQDMDVGSINLVDLVERGLLDLNAIDATDDIANSYTVKLLESKLPKRIRGKWFEKDSEQGKVSDNSGEVVNKKGGKERFERLLEFMKQERRHAERMVQLNPSDKKVPKDEKKQHYSNGVYEGRNQNQNHAKTPTHDNRCLVHPNATKPHLTRLCKAFLAKTAHERGQVIQDTGGCKFCLSLSHPGASCPFEIKWGPCNVAGCTEFHSKLVHGCGIIGISCYTFTYKNISHTLLLIQDVSTTTNSIKIFWDNGSSLALVSKKYVRRSGLVGIPVTYELITVGNQVTVHRTNLYKIFLKDKNGDNHEIIAYEIEEICGKIGQVKVGHLVHSFPSLKKEDVARYGGEIELLIGMGHAALHPVRTAAHEGLCLYDSQFNSAKILGGANQLIEGESPESSPAVSCHTKAQVRNVYVVEMCRQ